MTALLDELAEFGPFHVFRPNKDVRFSKDKTPYKDHIAAYSESQGGAGYYVQFSATGMIAGSGYYHMAGDQLDRYRAALDSDAVGGEIVAITDDIRRKGSSSTAIGALKTAPRGYARDHPRIELLRLKGLVGDAPLEAGEVDADQGRRRPRARYLGRHRRDERVARCARRTLDTAAG